VPHDAVRCGARDASPRRCLLAALALVVALVLGNRARLWNDELALPAPRSRTRRCGSTIRERRDSPSA